MKTQKKSTSQPVSSAKADQSSVSSMESKEEIGIANNSDDIYLLKKQLEILESGGFYARHHDRIMLVIWFLMVCVQWNCMGETLGIISRSQPNYSNTRFLIGVCIELFASLIFTLDFSCFKLWNSSSLQKYSIAYFVLDLFSGPLSLLIDVISLLLYSKLNVLATVLRASKCLAGGAARRVFSKVIVILPKVQDMFLCLFCVFFLFTYVATYLYSGLFQEEYYFNTIGFSFFTMLQIMTLDGWGEIGRDILRKQNMLSASFLILFVFIMAYFFWNILIGFILEILRTLQAEEEEAQKMEQSNYHQPIELSQIPRKNNVNIPSKEADSKTTNKGHKKNQQQTQKSTENSKIQVRDETEFESSGDGHNVVPAGIDADDEASRPSENNGFFENICFGDLNTRFVMGLYLLIIIDSLFHKDLRKIDAMLSSVLHVCAGMFFTFQASVIIFSAGDRFELERRHGYMIAFHLISGPVALIFDLISLSTTGTIGFGAICKLVKVFVITREMIMGAVVIFPVLLPAFLGIISIIFLLAMWALSVLSDVENFWVDFNTSVYTFVQILTLDDWAAKIIKDLLKQDRYLTPIVFVGFIFVANYFFLNMMVAFSSEVFEKLSTKDYVDRNKNKKIGFYERSEKENSRVYSTLSQFQSDINTSELVDKALIGHINDIGEQKSMNNDEKKFIEQLVELKYSGVQDVPIVFELNGKQVEITSNDLQYIRFNLYNSTFDSSNDSHLGIK